ncbi:hypothetical protein [Mycobacteroides abscessus]|uniref:Uncharacterized protein n=1 Tax=Mycobacteroides abscessus subsp. abscessus TaxID=1185650 RepID=A0AB38D7I5_9MYCO|nr:hypothetical protein [Mycobacteroides abscessus]SIB99936.1 Uncharacterised protein [Mycobacteroides abscessus subsp. abscessus]SIC25628.1 Uncharacterised protein [Mycobacteroides abscessus subsp. abscessus]SIC25862.1 Uncharacterised protein [Mycobacteroides abscessus subsp. abscessus]SIC34073.1 Uncharacterised protein [Mycobacteroides abscessus subsp. abscessus]SIF77951.1 Uncharacterised protein [Mycobacteroides abscessus subsp. abscessus]
MTTIYQSLTGTKSLAYLAIAATVGLSVVGCSHPTTPSGASSSGTISTSAEAHELVDVAAVWQTEPLPDCPKPPIVFNGAVPPGLSLPDKASVARQLAGVKSPGSPQWVKTKLGWVTKALGETRADIVHINLPGDDTGLHGFERYVEHVKAELQAGLDIPDSDTDGDYPEGCR